MTDLFEKVSSSQDKATELLNKIANAVPGFDGYFERKNRKASDKLLRMQIADQLAVYVNKIGDLQQEFVRIGEIAVLDDVETAVTKLQMFVDKIKFASYGYGGVFDAIRVNEDALMALYEFDAALLDKVEEVGHAVDNVETSMSTDGEPASIRHLVSLARELNDLLVAREHVIENTESVADDVVDDSDADSTEMIE
jgi:stringent starvation protein B